MLGNWKSLQGMLRRELFLLTSQCLTFNMSPHPLLLIPDLRHEKIPSECKSRIESRISRSSSPRDAMFVYNKLCEVRERRSWVSHLGNDYQHRRDGHVKGKAASRWDKIGNKCRNLHLNWRGNVFGDNHSIIWTLMENLVKTLLCSFYDLILRRS